MRTQSKAAPIRTAATVLAEIAALDEAAHPRAAMLAELEAERPALIDAGDIAAIEALDARIRRARIAGEVDANRRAKLVAEHEALDTAERYAADQAARRESYDAARTAAEEAARLYREEYPRLARELTELLARTTEIGQQVEAANARLPDHAALISMEFEPFRGRAEVRPTTRKFKRHVWVSKVTKQEVYQRIGDPSDYERQERSEEMTSPGVPAIPHVPLRHLVALPGLGFADAPFWTPHPGFLAPPGPTFNSFHQHSPSLANPPLGGGAPRSMAHIGGRI
ncbi:MULTISPECIES: hypothetical protein [unclassified Methylobacterium]|uniref:hypothetical protein n=1 Tax=unclassified Methylobacterium TaxID=2615210 RepID=UPI0011C1E070|nr:MULTISPECIES: hypothetical protein [unclassified Methylobacterium]QEE38838.1 hypothetical protein FVA80_07535 [Methylobacterium sp. WL1]TXN53820.1 hypothetical protein FV241_26665 [Methylobacterium sp. WL2]